MAINIGPNRNGPIDVSVIIVSKTFPNTHTRMFLDSTKLLTINYELVLITHQIKTDVRELFTEMFDYQPNLQRTRLVLMDQAIDLGPAHDRNIGARLAQSPNILFADDDTIFLQDIAELLDILRAGKCDGLQPLLLKSVDNSIIDSAGDFIWKSGPTYRPYSRLSDERLELLTEPLFIEEVPSLKGAFMLLKKAAFLAVGGFDSSFNFNYEDVDLGWRLTSAGFKLLFVPTIKAQHKGGRVSSGLAKQGMETVNLGIVNFYLSQFKLSKLRRWLGLFFCFQFEFTIHALVKETNIKKPYRYFHELVTANTLLLHRVQIEHRRRKSLSQKQSSMGFKKLESMAKGQRFFYKIS